MSRAKVGAPTQRKALMLLQGILRRAVVRGLIPVNPAQLVDKPKQRPTQLPQPLSPVTVEGIRANMLQPRSRIVPAAGGGKRPRRQYEASVGSPRDRQRDALIVSMLAYAGLRPIEDRGTQDAPSKLAMTGSRRIPCSYRSGRCWARTSDLRLVEAALSQLS